MKIQLSKAEIVGFKEQALCWADAKAEVLSFLDSNAYEEDAYSQYECLIAVGAEIEWKQPPEGQVFEALKKFAKANKKWLFGHLNYDLKNEVEVLQSKNADGLCFSESYFFVPTYLLLFHKDGVLEILSEREPAEQIWTAISEVKPNTSVSTNKINIQQRISKAAYLETIQKIRQHIIDGDCYEMNFCQEFYAEDVVINPLPLFLKMNRIAKAPFAAYYKRKDQYLLCGSPERFMCKQGPKIISQPIKGTIKRGKHPEEDQQLKEQLRNSLKDQAENVMIVDLVRNDLTKTCQTGSIQVEELFGVYSFEKVFQMISTISGILQEEQYWSDAIRAAFPMGSMTGAPKVISMQLIEGYEASKRGLYAGTVGYISPEENFDFNVVIRSLLYHASRRYLSFQVGGAIVYDSEPLAEYEECLLKSKTMLEALGAVES